MDQLHRRLTDEQIKVLLQSYSRGKMSRAQAEFYAPAYIRPFGDGLS